MIRLLGNLIFSHSFRSSTLICSQGRSLFDFRNEWNFCYIRELKVFFGSPHGFPKEELFDIQLFHQFNIWKLCVWCKSCFLEMLWVFNCTVCFFNLQLFEPWLKRFEGLVWMKPSRFQKDEIWYCGGTPSCVHHKLCHVALDRRVGHTWYWSSFRYHAPSSGTLRPFSSRKGFTTAVFSFCNGFKNHYFIVLHSIISWGLLVAHFP